MVKRIFLLIFLVVLLNLQMTDVLWAQQEKPPDSTCTMAQCSR